MKLCHQLGDITAFLLSLTSKIRRLLGRGSCLSLHSSAGHASLVNININVNYSPMNPVQFSDVFYCLPPSSGRVLGGRRSRRVHAKNSGEKAVPNRNVQDEFLILGATQSPGRFSDN